MVKDKRKVAVILSGSGVYDGSEIHESVLLLLNLAKQGLDVQCFAPDMKQHHVVDHVSGKEMKDSRNVLTEAARIARGKILPLHELNPDNFWALAMPGGFGAAKNLSTFALDGADCKFCEHLVPTIKGFVDHGKPILALCIAPVILAKLIPEAELTIGTDDALAKVLEGLGIKHVKCESTECHVDRNRKLITTPCYMHEVNITDVSSGIEKAVQQLVAFE